MVKISSDDSGFIIKKTDMKPAMLCSGTWRGSDCVGILEIPEKSEQANSVWSEGPGGLPSDNALCKITPEQFFDFARGQVLIERLQKKYPQLIGFFPVQKGIVFFTKHPITRKVRHEIASAVGGVYKNEDVFFCYSSNSNGITEESLPLVKRSLLEGKLPVGWEIAVGSEFKVMEKCPFRPIQVQYFSEALKVVS